MRFPLSVGLLVTSVALFGCDADDATQLPSRLAPAPVVMADLEPPASDSCRWNTRLYPGNVGNYAGSTCDPDSTWVDASWRTDDSIASLETPGTGFGCARDPAREECTFTGTQVSTWYNGLSSKVTAMGTCENGSPGCEYVQVKFVTGQDACCNDNQCAGGTPACENLFSNTCKECINNDYCDSPTPYCVNYACVECQTSGQCTSPKVCIDGECVDPSCSPDPTCNGRTCTTSADCTNDTCPLGRCMPNGTCSCPS
jgi:hypothetical protein